MPQDHQPVSFRRRQFVEAAITVISREGVARATTRRIAEVAELPTASLHYCFATKEDLFHAVYEAITAARFAGVGERIQQEVGLHQGVADILRSFMKWFQSSRDMQLASYELTMWSLRSSDSQHLARRVYRRYLDNCAQLLREVRTEEELDVDIENLSGLLVGVTNGLVLQWLSFDNSEEGISTDKCVKMVQNALSTLKHEAGMPG
ncbi:TetR/AcrR family transcriptional regulator [Arthrobacter sp. OV608]|uniref:TetR/AcrR family transcriptional regulator n=1 Tax=Arthrobacter sp. OV608 TaxID=1882768 RepID=UPI0008BEAB51|nr:TetR/AcrR family transcriptional regulator [Arthrobacter sp. OV608]SEQ26034.1 transcriptional regulator, TetR family [Arthrobacter sp. OV608]